MLFHGAVMMRYFVELPRAKASTRPLAILDFSLFSVEIATRERNIHSIVSRASPQCCASSSIRTVIISVFLYGVIIRSDHVILAQRYELREPNMSTGGRRGAEKSTRPL